MKFRSETFGFIERTVKHRRYTYFWHREASRQKIEKCLGPTDKPETQRAALEMKLKYLEGLQQELTETIKQTRQELEALPANTPDEGKPGHGKGRGTKAKGSVDGSDQRAAA